LRSTRLSLAILLPLLISFAGATHAHAISRAEIAVGKVVIGNFGNGPASILVPVRYPIEFGGRVAKTEVRLLTPYHRVKGRWTLRNRLNSGRIRRPDRRRSFTFVHSVRLSEKQVRQAGEEPLIRIAARGELDFDRDGKLEFRGGDRKLQAPFFGARPQPLCSSIPHLRVKPGRSISVPLPVCTSSRRWRISRRPDHGSARVRDGNLVYRAAPRFRGSDPLVLSGGQQVRITVGTAGDAVVRALGDSVTAGFGYYSNGGSMTIGRLYECRPAAREFNDACSSNSLNRTSAKGKLEYAPDYGLANDVSWAAQWANEHGVTSFKNFAVSGSEPGNWAPGGVLHKTAELLASEDPDYILMTAGANPLLSEMLFGVDNMGCAVESDIVGGYRECVEEAFAEVHLQANLKALYTYLVQNTDATIFLMRYHLSVPSTALAYSATQIAMMGKLLNREIEAVAAAVNPKRLQVVTPPHFDVGIDISPVFPSNFSCSRFDYEVDGPSVQSTPTQDELEALHPLSFCEGPESGPPWVIGGDTGIHPSAAGYAQMASRVPPPS
jgi:lysophospholipase L1-like esterase